MTDKQQKSAKEISFDFAEGMPELPAAAVPQTFAFIGKRGGGKSYAATKLCELMLTASAQTIALDPVGVWWGLRVPATKKNKAFDLPVFGGMHGDLPLAPQSGKLLAALVVERRLSAVLDVSHFIQSEQSRFVYDFLTEFFQLKKARPSAVHIFLEECQEFVPQNVAKGDGFGARMLHAGERLVKLGRNFGIGCSLISQRPQEVNKKVLNQTEVMFAFQMTGLQERDTITRWVADKGSREELVQKLPVLNVGEAYAWSPSWLRFEGLVKIKRKQTADVSATPQLGAGDENNFPENLSPVDVENLRLEMEKLDGGGSAGIDSSKKSSAAIRSADHKQLEADQAELDRREKVLLDREKAIEIYERGIVARIDAICREAISDLSARLEKLTNEMSEIMKSPPSGQDFVTAVKTLPPLEKRQVIADVQNGRKNGRNTNPHKKSSAGGKDTIASGEMMILIAVAQNTPPGAARDQLTILTGYKRSTRDAYIQRLRQQSLVEVGNHGLILVTQKGYIALPDDFEPLPAGAALRDYWFDRLPEGEAAIFAHIVHAYPNAIDRETLTSETGYKRSTRDAYIQRLTTRKLIVAYGRGQVKASGHLFD